MSSSYLIFIVFLAGLGAGWFANTWVASYQSNPTVDIASVAEVDGQGVSGTAISSGVASVNPWSLQPANSNQNRLNQGDTVSSATSASYPQPTQSEVASQSSSISATFDKLLSDRRYFDAISFFEEQKQQNEQIAIQLRRSLLKELQYLIEARNNSDFSELIDNYLSANYDDVDVLLLLADFNLANGSYLEVVDVYLLAKTYSYSNADLDKVTNRFNRFVEETDIAYTGRKNWWFLINLYEHINTSGLMTSTLQYRRAIAHLRSGDEIYAIEQFNQLLDDSLVGESAAVALNSLTDNTDTPVIVTSSPWEGADSVALQKLGNQYAVNLSDNRQENVRLLLDTGASMTAMSRASFDALNTRGDAVEQEKRVFRTANGLIQGMVFSIPELSLGSHVLENTQIAVIDFEDTDRGIDGLLGMNILGQFRFHIEQETSRLLLRRK